MEFPEKYIKRGHFELHSGGTSDKLYDVNSFLTDSIYTNSIIGIVPSLGHYVGIATGGAILAALVADRRRAEYSMVKDGELKGEVPLEDYVLVDDVCTTEGSIREAIKIIRKEPSKIFVVVDRRKDKSGLEIEAMFRV